ncbi:MAG: methylenetetrahydrofolate reductase [NAD(P)H] [Gammaproteobacteria bacterium]|nr:methylenetetrahydrofolate reductase [NAD(P)H] [Gammaproteobacteria bacterium]
MVEVHTVRLSFEFFPPRTREGEQSLGKVAAKLDDFSPDFFSCTYGAGGSTRAGTREVVAHLGALGMSCAPHLSIGSDTQDEINHQLDAYAALDVNRIVALRGDPPSGMARSHLVNNAETLVRWIREHSGNRFHLEVAAYPEVHPDAVSPEQDLDYFKRKVDAGANSAITQYFYNVHAYFDFLARCDRANLNIPIIPGIMPLTNYEGIVRFSQNCGADIPRWIRKQLETRQDDKKSLLAFGVEVVTRLCEDLVAAGVSGLHFYTLNRWGASSKICRNLGLENPGG